MILLNADIRQFITDFTGVFITMSIISFRNSLVKLIFLVVFKR